MILRSLVPTYEYECPTCPRVFEVRQRISEPPLTTCDRCGGPIRRLLAPAPFILKGGGWHATDYPSEARKKALSSESGEKPPPATKPSTDSGPSPSSGSPDSSAGSETAKGSTKDASKS